MISTKISSKGQITLPRRVRKCLSVGPGDRLAFVMEGGHVLLRALGPCDTRSLAGSLQRYARKARDQRAVRNEVKEGVARAAARQA